MGSRTLAPVAQTSLQLLRQMHERSFSAADFQRVHRAYWLALPRVATLFRGSGKPFLCHLVGTASLICEAGFDAVDIAAAMLHSVYADRIQDSGSANFSELRPALQAEIGLDVEARVFAYFDLPAEQADAATALGRWRIATDLADTLEDALDGAHFLHGEIADTGLERGSAAFRLAKLAAELPTFYARAGALGLTQFTARMQQLEQDAQALALAFATLKTGRYSSFRP
jgi:hypothetical protein